MLFECLVGLLNLMKVDVLVRHVYIPPLIGVVLLGEGLISPLDLWKSGSGLQPQNPVILTRHIIITRMWRSILAVLVLL
jgi:hypothetical protein